MNTDQTQPTNTYRFFGMANQLEFESESLNSAVLFAWGKLIIDPKAHYPIVVAPHENNYLHLYEWHAAQTDTDKIVN